MNVLTAIALLATALQPQSEQPSGRFRTDSICIYYPLEQAHTISVHEAEEPIAAPYDTPTPCFSDNYTLPYDSLVAALQEQRAREAFDRFFDDFIDIECTAGISGRQLPDSVYEARLRRILSPIHMPYNEVVKRYILNYTLRKTQMENVLSRARYYFPMIEEELDRAGLPVELRMLPVVESALSPTATSRAGATGLWQFIYTTGKVYGLEINSFVDQRRDPVLSTRAACRYLKDLYRIYNDWTLALAAYNCGPGNVNKAIRRAGNEAKSFWDIYPYLPTETRGYVPSFIAATYAYTFSYQHAIAPLPTPLPLATDTVQISRPLHFDQIASTIHLPKELLRSLNPQYKMDIVPAAGKSYTLTLPMGEMARFIENEEQIHAKDTLYMAQYLKPSRTSPARQEFSLDSYTYRVQSGDTLSSIATRHNVTVAQLMKWNNLKSAHKLRIGQRLEIYR